MDVKFGCGLVSYINNNIAMKFGLINMYLDIHCNLHNFICPAQLAKIKIEDDGSYIQLSEVST